MKQFSLVELAINLSLVDGSKLELYKDWLSLLKD